MCVLSFLVSFLRARGFFLQWWPIALDLRFGEDAKNQAISPMHRDLKRGPYATAKPEIYPTKTTHTQPLIASTLLLCLCTRTVTQAPPPPRPPCFA